MEDYFNQTTPDVQIDPDQEKYVQDMNALAVQEQQEAEQAKQAELQQQEAAKKQAEEDAKMKEYEGAGGAVKLVGESAASTLLGVGDFVSDVAGIVPFTKPLDNWWDENSPRFNHPLTDAVRNASSVIIPSLVGGAGVLRGAALASKGMQLAKGVRIAGSIAAAAGVDASVTAISSTSERDDNVAGALNQWLGTDIPWGTRDSDSPDVRKKKNVMEAAGLAVGVDLIAAAFALKKGIKVTPKDEVAEASLEVRSMLKNPDDDAVTSAVTKAQSDRMVEVDEEALRALEAGPATYNPFINNVAEAQAKGVVNVDANAILAKVDHARIQGNIGTTNGRATPVATEYFQKKFMQAADGTERAEDLKELFGTIKPQVDATVDSVRLTAKQIDSAVDNLVDAVLKPDGGIEEFTKTVEGMKKNVYNEAMLLDEENALVAATAFRRVFDEVFDPDAMRASAMLTQNAADNVADAANAAVLLDGLADTSRQQELVLNKMAMLAGEVRVNQAISGMALNYKKFLKAGKKDEAVAYLATADTQLNEVISNAQSKGQKLVAELQEIKAENPEFLKPFMEAYDSTNGDVDTLFKLHRYGEDRIGLIKKAFYDGNPEVPSAVVQGLQGVRYNNILSGMSAVRAAVGNATYLVAKPVSVLAGAFATKDADVMRRALHTFGGVGESFRRGLKLMGDEWRLANSNPEGIMTRGRADLAQSRMDDLEVMESMAEGWRANGESGKVAMWNLAKGLSWYNNNPFVRYGTNAMYAIDGFTKAFATSMVTRAKAYDEFFDATKGVLDEAGFAGKQKQLYDEAFDQTGLLTDKAASFVSSEISLNLDSDVVNRLENLMQKVPAMKSLFMFPRTGVNALEMGWSFTPMSGLGMAMGRARKVMKANTTEEMIEALAEHGIDWTGEGADIAFRSLKSEYIGRQIMGSTVVMGAGLWALEGNLTGNGPQDAAEKRRMISMGWQPQSIKDPISGEWRSYRGFEPFDSLLGMIGDAVYNASRVDEAVTEDFFRKISYSISMNVANKTFLSGFEPLVSMLSGDEGAWNRFMAGQVDSLIPYTGVRSTLSQAITPQLKDVENDMGSYLKNRNKFLFSQDDQLKDLVDIYTGEPIRYQEPLTAAANALMPFFKSNGGMEPWRQWLLSSGWDNLQALRTDKNTGQPLNTEQRSYINNWIAQNMDLKGAVEKMMNRPDGYWDKKIREYTKDRGQQTQSEFPIKETVVHEMLDKIHNDAFNAAFAAMEQENAVGAHIAGLTKQRNSYLNRGQTSEATDKATQLKNLLEMQPK